MDCVCAAADVDITFFDNCKVIQPRPYVRQDQISDF